MKISIFLRISALLMASLLLLGSCTGKPRALSYKDGVYQAGDVSYCQASMNYRAQSLIKGTVIYNLSRSSKKEFIPLYAIEGLSTDDWLADENYTLYHNPSITLPTLSEMNPCSISILLAGDPTGTVLGHLGEDRQDAIDDLLEILTVGTSYSGDRIAYTPTEYYELLFESEEHPGIFYVLEYWTYGDDVKYLDENGQIEVKKGIVYDVTANRFYVMGEILENYFFQ